MRGVLLSLFSGLIFVSTMNLGVLTDAHAFDLSKGEEILPTSREAWGYAIPDKIKFDENGDGTHKRIFELTSPKSYKFPYELQLSCGATGGIKKGDVLLLSFNIRCLSTRDETGEATVGLVCERRGPPWTKSLFEVVRSGKEWKKINMPFEAIEDMGQGTVGINFMLGFAEQTMQISDISLLNFHANATVKDLPRSVVTYEDGRNPNAPWRKEAEERIEKIRKGDLKVRVIDASEKPVSQAEVKVKMQKHAFGFGTAVSFPTNPEDRKKYEEILVKYFNKGLPENALKWDFWIKDKNPGLEIVKWLNNAGMRAKGHNLIWPGWHGWVEGQSWDYMPRSVYESRTNPEKMRKIIDEHFADETPVLVGQLEEWDVINEPFWNDDVMKVLGDEEMAHWFKLARQYDPKAKLILNEAITMSWSGGTENLIRVVNLIDHAGAHVDGIGIQCHYGTDLTPIPIVYSNLDKLSRALPGKFIQITEFDQYGTDRTVQADYMRDFMTIIFSHPAASDFIFWGFWEGMHWRPEAAMWNRDWSINPNGQAYVDLVTKKWWTNEDGKSDAKGELNLRGFLGDYEIIVTKGNQSKTVKFTIKPGSNLCEIKMP